MTRALATVVVGLVFFLAYSLGTTRTATTDEVLRVELELEDEPMQAIQAALNVAIDRMADAAALSSGNNAPKATTYIEITGNATVTDADLSIVSVLDGTNVRAGYAPFDYFFALAQVSTDGPRFVNGRPIFYPVRWGGHHGRISIHWDAHIHYAQGNRDCSRQRAVVGYMVGGEFLFGHHADSAISTVLTETGTLTWSHDGFCQGEGSTTVADPVTGDFLPGRYFVARFQSGMHDADTSRFMLVGQNQTSGDASSILWLMQESFTSWISLGSRYFSESLRIYGHPDARIRNSLFLSAARGHIVGGDHLGGGQRYWRYCLTGVCEYPDEKRPREILITDSRLEAVGSGLKASVFLNAADRFILERTHYETSGAYDVVIGGGYCADTKAMCVKDAECGEGIACEPTAGNCGVGDVRISGPTIQKIGLGPCALSSKYNTGIVRITDGLIKAAFENRYLFDYHESLAVGGTRPNGWDPVDVAVSDVTWYYVPICRRPDYAGGQPEMSPAYSDPSLCE